MITDTFTVSNTVAAKLADAVHALEAADANLNLAIDDFDAHLAGDEFDEFDLAESVCTVRLSAGMLSADLGAGPGTIRRRAFDALIARANKNPGNSPHVEGATLAVQLAYRSMVDAMKAHNPGLKWDQAYSLMVALSASIRSLDAFLSSAVKPFAADKALAAILAGRKTPRRARAVNAELLVA